MSDQEALIRALAATPPTQTCHLCDGHGKCLDCQDEESQKCFCYIDRTRPFDDYLVARECPDELWLDLPPLYDCPTGECQCTHCLYLARDGQGACPWCDGRGWEETDAYLDLKAALAELRRRHVVRARADRNWRANLANEHNTIERAASDGPVVYLIRKPTAVKIGWSSSARGAKDRLSSLQTGNEAMLELVAMLPDDAQRTREARLHQLFAQFKAEAGNEWFEYRGPVKSYVRHAARVA